LQIGQKVSYSENLGKLKDVTAKSIADTAFNGDEVAIDVHRLCAHFLGKALAQLIDILNPELIVMGSIYGRAKTLLEPVMLEVIRQEALPDSYDACKIVPAGLFENIGDIAHYHWH
jgi:glucokinase